MEFEQRQNAQRAKFASNKYDFQYIYFNIQPKLTIRTVNR